IPYGAKDLLDASGAPTTWGSPAMRDRVVDTDATVIARLARAGAPLAAKLAMIELAGGGGYRFASASLQGATRNPWDLTRWAGGSSSGSAAAVAAGLLPFAIGSETSGSIGGPSARCGVTGLRPTLGLVGRGGVMPFSWTLDKIGPIARSADDCALVLAAIAGRDATDPLTVGRSFRALDGRAARATVRRARLGFAEEDLEECSPHARPALERGIAELRRVVPRVVRAALPADIAYGGALRTIMLAEAAQSQRELIAGERFALMIDEKSRAGLRAGGEVRAVEYLDAMRVRDALDAAFREIFRTVDVIVSPTRPTTASALEDPIDRPEPARPATPRGNLGLIPAANLVGLPAVFFPCGLAPDGLPVGLQLVGPRFSEPLLVAIASAYQRETAHHRLRAPF
ncbi:MAG: amidase, partial [Alphaproteobacteria bacterium]|nr:amidase [Alphaproteobacteria bacterium]